MTKTSKSSSSEGVAINTSSAGSGTHTIVQFGTHYLSETGTLPTGITAGQDYFVLAASLTTDTFRFSATSGGAAINTSGSASGTIVLKTGSDSNNGLAPSAAGAFLTIQKAIDTALSLDLNGFSVTIQAADGIYPGATQIGPGVGIVAAGKLAIKGNTGTPGNVVVSATAANCFTAVSGGIVTVQDMELRTTTSGALLRSQRCQSH